MLIERRSAGVDPITIAEPAHGLDRLVVAGRRQALSKSADVNVHGALFHERVIAPYLVEELGAAEDAADVGHEEMQQTGFAGPLFDFAVDSSQSVLRPIEV